MAMTSRATLALLAEENDAQALRTDPSGFLYAVLQILREGEHYTEADFGALVERGRQLVGLGGTLRVAGGGKRDVAGARAASVTPARSQTRQRALSTEPVRRRRRDGGASTGGIRYGESEEERERMAEAERIGALEGQDLTYEPLRPYEDAFEAEDEGLGDLPRPRRGDRADLTVATTLPPTGPQEVTLTLPQLKALLAEERRLARTQPVPAPESETDVDVEDEEEDELDEAVDVTPADAPDDVLGEEVPVTAEDAPDATEERDRDTTGRFVTAKPAAKPAARKRSM